MQFTNLDVVTRRHMRAEAEADLAAGRLYLSDRLSPVGAAEWPDLLLETIEAGDDASLAALLNRNGRLNAFEPYVRQGRPGMRKVPRTAAMTLAEGEFNRFYIRGVCARALAEGIEAVEVYRAKAVAQPRPESTVLLGRRIDPAALLEDLRTHTQVDTVLGVPSGPNSGLSVRLVISGSPQGRGGGPGSSLGG